MLESGTNRVESQISTPHYLNVECCNPNSTQCSLTGDGSRSGLALPSPCRRCRARSAVGERVVKPHIRVSEVTCVVRRQRQPMMPSGRGNDAVLPRHREPLGAQFGLESNPFPGDAHIEGKYSSAELVHESLDLLGQPALALA